ncbi:MAGUK p55 subfamily member 6 [Trichonephila clavipes]|nr:MAGUK p55 subfamily member 6 [Trichonephila clavipes]
MVICGSKHDDDGRELLRSMEKINEQKQGTAFQHVRENIEDLNGRVGARDTDIIFLKGLMESPVVSSLVKVSKKVIHFWSKLSLGMRNVLSATL